MALHRTLLLSPILGLAGKLGKHCVPVLEVQFPSREHHFSCIEDASSDLFTWKALNGIFVTLLKHTPDSTAIYVHPSDMHYHASSLGSLGASCPVGTSLLAQVRACSTHALFAFSMARNTLSTGHAGCAGQNQRCSRSALDVHRRRCVEHVHTHIRRAADW